MDKAFEYLRCDGLVTFGQHVFWFSAVWGRAIDTDGIDPLQRAVDGSVRHIHDVDAAHRDGQGFASKPSAFAGSAGPRRHVPFDLGSHVVRLGVFVPTLQIGDDALEAGRPVVCLASLGVVSDLDGLPFGAVEDDFDLTLGQFLEGRVSVELVCPSKGFKLAEIPGRHRSGSRPRLDCALSDGPALVRNDKIGFDLQLVAETCAG